MASPAPCPADLQEGQVYSGYPIGKPFQYNSQDNILNLGNLLAYKF